MILARVTGEVVSTVKNAEFKGHKLLLLRPLTLDGEVQGEEFIAVDTVDAGIGDPVLVNKEGGGTRLALDNSRIPLQALIVAVVDDWHLPETRHKDTP